MHNGAIETVKRMILVSNLFMLLSTLAFNGFVVLNGETEEVAFHIKMSVTYHNNGTENWDFTEEDRAICLFMNNTWQTVQLIDHSYSLENTTFDEDGNPIAVLQFPESQLEPGENVSYTITYYALSKPRLFSDIKEEDSGTLDDIPEELESYCGAGDAWLVDDPTLQDLAYDITNGETKVLTIVKKFITWIRDNITYKTRDTPRYPNETYTRREGDCDDQAILFITLCRILKIPSFLQIGCIYLPTSFDDSEYWDHHVRSILKRIGWHGWGMVYVPPWGWLPVDLTYVMGGFGDPLNAIENAAVTSQDTLHYLNISQKDYIVSSLTYRDFLKKNDFYVYMQDEMIEVPPTNHGDDTLEWLFPWILVTTIVVAVVVIAWIFVVIRREKRLKETEFKSNSSFGS